MADDSTTTGGAGGQIDWRGTIKCVRGVSPRQHRAAALAKYL
jgi:hypothetical protein